MQYIVDTEKPDLIVCSGDNIMTTGLEGLKEFIALMESYKTPWTFIYGNHDAESTTTGYNKKSISDYLESCDAEYLLFDTGYIDTENNRYGNFSISILNSDGTKTLGAVILLDSGAYNSKVSSYDSLTEGQIAWYKNEIDRLDALYSDEGTIPSVVFAHIQLPEYYTAYRAALSGKDAQFIIKQQLTSTDIKSIQTGGPTNVNTGFFQAMKDKESTVAFFCGHAHLLDFQVKMDGIVLGFAPQTGFSTLFADNDMPRNTYIYSFEENFEFTTTSCPEPCEGLGLTFTGTFDSVAEYDNASGTHITTNNFNYGNSIIFAYDGIRITTENTTIAGDFSTATSSTGKGGFYTRDGKTFIFDGKAANTCTFTYDPATKTLTIDAEEVEANPDAPTSVTYKTKDSDAGGDAITLWTKAGTKLKYVEDPTAGGEKWVGNGRRYYIVVDAEAKIAYAVLWPMSGYGGPMGTGYYAHPDYSDYKTNPSIVTLDGFANDWSSGGIGYTLFEIVVPEGGFAITGHGTANFELVDMLSQGTVADYGVANINTRSIYKSNIRVSYDLDEKTISITTVEE